MTDWFSTYYKSFGGYKESLNEMPYYTALVDFFSETRLQKTTSVGANFRSDASFSVDYKTSDSTNRRGTSEIFIGTKGSSGNRCVTLCAIETIHVDAEVFCMAQGIKARTNCGVQRIRQIFQPVFLYDVSNWDLNLVPPSAVSFFGTHFGTVGRGLGVSFAEMFLEDPSTTFTYDLHPVVNLWNISMELFEDRLSLLFNTLVGSTYDPQSVLGAGERNMSRVWNTTALLEVPLPAIYVLDTPWISTYFVAMALMTLAAFGTLVLRCYLVTPPVLGSVGGLAQNSPYFAHLEPTSNSTESGEETVKRLRHVRVGMVDVQAGSDVGRMALAPAEVGERVRKGRWYE